jgi:hypothetical protein
MFEAVKDRNGLEVPVDANAERLRGNPVRMRGDDV